MGAASDRDIWRKAGALVAKFGEHAPVYAMHSIDLCIERSDHDGAAEWRRVWRAIEALIETASASPRKVH